MFDAAAGFGGYRESGFGRDGGKEVSVPDLIITSLIDYFVKSLILSHYRDATHIHISDENIQSEHNKELIRTRKENALTQS